MSKNKTPYPAQFREQMLELVEAGRKPRELAAEFGCHVSTIHDWLKKARNSKVVRGAETTSTSVLNAQERQELIELRRKLKQVQMERDILAKATAWFAGKSEKTSTPSTNS